MNIKTSTDDLFIMKDDNTVHAHFGSLDSVVSFNDAMHNPEFNKRSDWNLNTTGPELLTMINDRVISPQIAKRLKTELPLQLEALRGYSKDTSVTFEEDGFLCDTTAFYAGEENCMLNIDTQLRRNNTIWLTSSITSRYDVKCDAMINRGVALIRTVKTLQEAGYNVGLGAYFYGRMRSGEDLFCTVVAKAPSEPLNEIAIAQVFAHPSFYRTVCFNIKDKASGHNDTDLGQKPNVPFSLFKHSFIEEGELSILEGAFGFEDCNSNPKAEHWIKHQLEDIVKEQQEQDAA